jgi:ATP-dependent helicase/nuclease subunit B
VATRLFAPPLQATAAQLETFATCAFRHFLRYGLALTEREPPGVTGLDLSRLYHHVLHALVSTAVRDGIDLADPAAPITDETIHALAQKVGKSLRGELMLSSARNEYLLERVEKTLREVVAAHREMLRRGSFRPTKAAVAFGSGAGAALPPLKVTTPGGAEVAVSGAIDRVDTSAGGGEVTAFDYRLGTRALSLQEVYYGLSLQLLTGLLALADGGDKPRPAAAFYLQTTRGLGQVKHPSEALDPADPLYLLRVKPRGIVEAGFVPTFDAALGEGMSQVLNVSVKKGGGFGNRRSSDVAEKAEFDALLAHVRKRLGELADGVLSGEIGVHPYRVNTETPCPRCDYRAVCRFDPSVDRYNHLVPLGKEQVLKQLAAEGGNEA